MHSAIDDYVREIPHDWAAAVAEHLENEIGDESDAVAVRWTGGRGILALGPTRLYTLHEHPHEDHPPTLNVSHYGSLRDAVVEEARRWTSRRDGFVTTGVALRHPLLPGGRVEAEGVMTTAEEAASTFLRAVV